MENSDAIAMLKSIIANIEAGHTTIAEVKSENPIGSLCAVTFVMSGIPQIGRMSDS